MEVIKSLNELETLISTYKEGKKGMYTNFYLMSDEIEKLISAGKLFYDNTTNLLQVFCDEGKYYKVYFWGVPEEKWEFVKRDKTLLCDVLCGVRVRDKDRAMQEKLIEDGFLLHAENLQFVISVPEQLENAKQKLENGLKRLQEYGYTLEVADKGDMACVHELWEKYIDQYALDKEDPNGENGMVVHCIKDENGSICATRAYKNMYKKSWAHHITVDEGQRGKGLARILLAQQIVEADKEECNQFLCWIEKNNTASIKLHSSWGQFNNKVSWQYIKV